MTKHTLESLDFVHIIQNTSNKTYYKLVGKLLYGHQSLSTCSYWTDGESAEKQVRKFGSRDVKVIYVKRSELYRNSTVKPNDKVYCIDTNKTHGVGELRLSRKLKLEGTDTYIEPTDNTEDRLNELGIFLANTPEQLKAAKEIVRKRKRLEELRESTLKLIEQLDLLDPVDITKDVEAKIVELRTVLEVVS